MPTLHLLGTGAAVSDPHRTTTMLAFEADDDTVVVDCGGDVIQRLMESGVDVDSISALIITHEHPDHVSGFPLFMEKIWLAGRRRPIPIYGIAPALDQARRCFATFDTSGWEGMPEIRWNEVAYEGEATVFENESWSILASPGTHGVPVIGLRVTATSSKSITTYSCDTAPSEAIARLATGADVLIHEANGAGPGHSSASQAAEIARAANVERLILVHLPPGDKDGELAKAQSIFEKTEHGRELGRYEL